MIDVMNVRCEPAGKTPDRRFTDVRAPAIAGAVLMPHAPILIPAVAGTRGHAAEASRQAMHAAARFVMSLAPETVVVISPHSPRKPGAFGLWAGDRLQGSFAQFNATQARVTLPSDQNLVKAIRREAGSAGVATWLIQNHPLDHGALVPLWFLAQAGWAGPTVVVSLNYPDEGGLVGMGNVIRHAASALHRPIAIVASGDMSHCLTPDAPCGFHPEARQFDETFIRLISSGAYQELGDISVELREHAAEDAVDSTMVAFAATGWNASGHQLLSYEAPFGVGYGVAILCSSREAADIPGPLMPTLDIHAGTVLPGLARRAVETALNGTFDCPPAAKGRYLSLHRGVFVTAHHVNGDLRGCMGTIVPACANLVAETWRNARLALLHDDRFAPVSAEELQDLRLEVSVLHPPETVSSLSELDPRRFGVIVSTNDGRRGLLLPGIPEITTPEKQVRLARNKGFIWPHEPVLLQRFEVDRFKESNESQETD
jgi:MEMO1 family protein